MCGKAVKAFAGPILAFVKNKGILWIFVIFISGWSTVNIFILLKNRYETDSTSIGISTAYSRWTNTFPSIGICLIKSRINEAFSSAVRRRFPGQNIPYTYIKNIYEFVFRSRNNLSLKQLTCENLNSTCGVDILEMRRELFPTNCSDFLIEVCFAGKLIPDCEKIFKFHELEMGYCFVANSFLDYDSTDKMPLHYSSLDKNKNLRLVLRSGQVYNYELYVQSPEDLPYFNAITYAVSLDPMVHSFNVEEIHNSEDVINEPVSQRMCKFPSESTIEGVPYSYSTCMSILRGQFEMQNCNCTLFSYEDSEDICGMDNMECLGNEVTNEMKNYVETNVACLPSCMEQQITNVGSFEDRSLLLKKGELIAEIHIASTPTVRYYRTVTQTKLDLIVGIGSVIGLFFGASLLNLFEIISFLFKKFKSFL
ncbi:uncharacterized protein LOC108107392 [Drosophila eugracilis]|uniref:uncharacterized protein LOC108107392 n=1 Tax=Drosophila eugracilis TaxID=29029 RepID=UPI0007E86F9D|nr:uncharacterized protein LOC108107392 [Drosophila eugracilis]